MNSNRTKKIIRVREQLTLNKHTNTMVGGKVLKLNAFELFSVEFNKLRSHGHVWGYVYID